MISIENTTTCSRLFSSHSKEYSIGMVGITPSLIHYSREVLQPGGLVLRVQQVIAALVVDLQVGDVGGVDGARRLRVWCM